MKRDEIIAKIRKDVGLTSRKGQTYFSKRDLMHIWAWIVGAKK